MSGAAALVRMANQIATNLAHQPQDTVVAELAAHLRTSWASECARSWLRTSTQSTV
ncbi:MAG: formate dehydrogenase subunit delta [Cellulomonas sp.]|nr:formate dehydrogenase subunit delta [Cellulomonas sp.]